MSTVDVISPAGKATGSVELPAEIFEVQTNIPLIHQVVVAQLAAARQGTHSTKTRGDVRGGGKKPYRQKGTGRARQGSTRAPQFAGGGVVHGPHPRDYSQRTPKKMKAAALRGALSDRARHGRVHVLSSLVEGDTPSTKAALAVLASLSESRHVLIVLERDDSVSLLSLRNIPAVHVLFADQLNTYDVLISDDVVFTSGSLEVFLAGAPKGKGATAVATESEAAQVDAPLEVAETAVAEKPAKKAAAKKAVAAEEAPAEVSEVSEKPAKKAAAKKAAASDEAPAEVSEKPAKKAATKKAAATDEAPTEKAEKPAKKAAAKKAAAEAEADEEDAT
jgi:large subunit ribosomal protein L4